MVGRSSPWQSLPVKLSGCLGNRPGSADKAAVLKDEMDPVLVLYWRRGLSVCIGSCYGLKRMTHTVFATTPTCGYRPIKIKVKVREWGIK